MATQVEERVVSMQFNNSQFESSASTTLNTLDRLKEALNFSGVDRGFNDITVAANGVNLNGLGSAIDSIRIKFSTLEAVALSVLNNMVNRAMDAGASMLQSLTISPILDGFREYELKMGSIQTIMANVNSQSQNTANTTAGSIASVAESASKAAAAANKQAQKDLKAAQKAETKAFQAQAQAELKAFNKAAKEEIESLQEAKSNELEVLSDSYEEKLKELQKSQKTELKELKNGYSQQLKELTDEQNAELDALSDAHKRKLDLYEEEYLAKIKSVDEERYNALKAIQDEIDALEKQTEAENKARKEAAQQEKLNELQRLASTARSERRRTETAKELAEYEAELAEERAQEERKEQIERLKDQMNDVKDVYQERIDAVKEEYSERKDLENDSYSDSASTIREHYTELKEAAQETYAEQLEAMQEQQETMREMLSEQYKIQKKNIQSQLSDELDAIRERQETERQAIQDRQEQERDALNERQSDELDAISTVETTSVTAANNVASTALNGVNNVKKALKEVTLDEVTDALDELNTYADKTIYNFADMTSNIGKFVSAGVGLDDSVDAIKGFSNVAALSGATSEQASRAMYQLAQGIASGKILLRDWMSMESNSVNSKAFQNSLIETARVHGVAIDDMIAEEGAFRDTLSRGWLTSDIMIETLRKFTGDLSDEELADMGYTDQQIAKIQEQAKLAVDAATKVRTYTQLISTMRESVGSGWAKTFELIFGNFDEATTLWTKLNDVFGAMIDEQSDERNQLLEDWKKWGGRDVLIMGFTEMWTNIQPIVTAVQEGFREIIPETTYNDLVNLSLKFEEFASNLKLSDAAIGSLKSTVKGVASIFSLIGDAVGAFFKVFAPSQDTLGGVIEGVLGFTGRLGDMITNLAEATKEGNVFETIFTIIKNGIEGAVGAILGFIGIVADFIKMIVFPTDSFFIDDFQNDLSKEKGPLSSVFSEILNVLSSFKDGWGATFDSLGDLAEAGIGALETVVGGIGGSIVSFGTWIGGAADGVKSALEGFFTTNETVIETDGGELQGVFGTIWDKIEEVFGKLKDLPGALVELGGALGKTIGEFIHGIIDSLSITDIFKTITGVESIGILSGFNKILNGLGDMFKGGKGLFGSISDGIGTISNSISEMVKSFEKSDTVDIIKELGKAMAILTLSLLALSTIDSESLGASMAAITVALGEFSLAIWKLDSIGQQSTVISKDGINIAGSNAGKMVKDLAFAMLELAAAMKLIASIDSEQMNNALTAISVFAGEITVVVPILTNASKKAEEGGDLPGLKTFAFAIIELGVAMKLMSGMELDDWALSMSSIFAFSIIAGITIPVMTKSSKSAEKGGDLSGLKTFAESLIVLGISMRIIGGMELDDWAKSMTAIGAYATIAAIAIPRLSKASRSGEVGKLNGLMTFAKSLIVLGISMRIIGGMDPSEWERAMVSVGGFAVAIAIVMPILYNASKSGKQGELQGLISFGESLILLSVSMRILAGLNWEEIGKSLVAMGGAVAIMAGAMAVFWGISSQDSFDADNLNSMCDGMIKLAASILILTPAMMGLGSMDIWSIVKALIAIAGVFTIVGIAAFALQPVAPIITALSGSIALLGVGIAGIGVGLLAFSAALTALAVAGSGIVASFLFTLSGLVTGILDLIIDVTPKIGELVTTLIATVCSAIIADADILTETFLVLLENLLTSLNDHVPTIVATGMDLIINVCNALKERVPEAVEAVMGLVGAILTAVMAEINKIDFSAFEKGIEGIGLLSALIVVIAGVSPLVGPAAVGLVKMGLLVAELTALLAIMGAINQIPGIDWLINEGGDLLENIGNAIGKFFGGIVGGIAEGVSDALPAIGQNLSDFMDNAQTFFDGIQDFKPETAKAVGYLAEAILVLTASNVLDQLTKFLTGGNGSLSKFGDELSLFAPGFKSFADQVSNVKPDVVQGAAAAAKSLAEMAAAIPNEGGFLAKLVGDNSLSKFGEELEKFGPNIVGFANSVSDLSVDSVEKGVNAAKLVADFSKTIPNEGGFLAKITGDNSLKDFAAELMLFGPSIMAFALSTNALDADAVQTAINSAQLVSDFAKTIPASGGFVTLVTGDNSLSKFSSELVLFGPSIAKFADSVKDIDTNGVTAAVTTGMMVAGLVSSLPEAGGIKTVWDGTTDFAGFALACVALGAPIKKFADDTSGISAESAAIAATVGMMIANLNDAIPDSGGLKSIFFGDKDLTKFSESLSSLANGIVDFCNITAVIDSESFSNTVLQIGYLIDLADRINNVDTTGMTYFGQNLTTMAAADIQGLINTFSGSADSVKEEAGKICGYAIEGISGKDTEMKTAGETSGKQAIDGVTSAIDNYISSITDAGKKICNELKDTLKDNLLETDFSDRGSDVIDWVVEGITTNLDEVTTAVSDLASINIVKELTTDLPKLTFTNISKDQIVAGLTNGLTLGLTTISQAVTSTATSTTNYIIAAFSETKFRFSGINIMIGMSNGIYNSTYLVHDAIDDLAQDVYDYLNDEAMPSSDFESIGENIVSGIENGISSKAHEIYEAAETVASTAASTVNDTLLIESPSKVMQWSGNMFGEGFINGIRDMISLTGRTSLDMSESAIDPITAAIQRISDSMESADEFQPTITPVVDLSNVNDAAGIMSGIFNALPINMSSSLAQSSAAGFRSTFRRGEYADNTLGQLNAKVDALANRDGKDTEKMVNYNTFNIRSTDPKQAAEEVSYIMQHQVERRRAVWAK